MKATTASAIVGALLINSASARPVVDETYPYTGPAIPVGDWVDPTVNGNGKGFPRLVEPPAVKPANKNPSNNVNVISLAYIPDGINVHFQTPFGIGQAPTVFWGEKASALNNKATGKTHTYDRTPPCSLVAVTQCSQFYHEVQIPNLKPDTTYYYQIPGSNGTTTSEVLEFTTSRAAGDSKGFTAIVLNDMGYTNAGGTYEQLLKAVDEGAAFAWHGGDLSYADDWYSGILPCESDWPVCYNGTSSELPSGITPEYETPLPAGEVANQGGPLGGDMNVLYESNWDLWQQWMVNVTAKIPYMVMPGNHEATCAEFDGPNNELTAYLNDDVANGTAAESTLTYYSCPPSQRNFTAYQHRFRMPGAETGGVGNFWYSFDYGLAHFISVDGETDYADSPEWPFARDLSEGETHPTEDETYITDSGPFGPVTNITDNKAYAQYQWLAEDLASIDRTKTPWVFVMSHRPMYSSETSSYQAILREAYEDLFLEYGVDMYLAGHIHWYERLLPLGTNGTIDESSVVNNNTYYTNPGVSMTHIINGMAGNVESHSFLDEGEPVLPITTVLDQSHYGFSKLEVVNSTVVHWSYVRGDGGIIGDQLTLIKRTNSTSSNTTSSAAPSGTSSIVGTAPASTVVVTETVSEYTTYCPSATSFTQGSSTYTVTAATTLTITDCPCTLTHTLTSSAVAIETSVPGGPNYNVTSKPYATGTGAPGPVGTSSFPGGIPTPQIFTGAAGHAMAAPMAGVAALTGLVAYFL